MASVLRFPHPISPPAPIHAPSLQLHGPAISSALHSGAIRPVMPPPLLPVFFHLVPPSIHPPSILPSITSPISLGICPSTHPLPHLLDRSPLTSSALPPSPSSLAPLRPVHPPTRQSTRPVGPRQPLLGSRERQRAETQLLVLLLHGAGAGLPPVRACVRSSVPPPTAPPPLPSPTPRPPLALPSHV